MPVGQRGRGCATGDHLLWEPVEGGTDGLRGESGEERTDRERCDGSGLQGNRQTATLRLGDEMERVWSGGGAEPAVLNPYDGAMGSVLGEDRSMGLPGGGVIHK